MTAAAEVIETTAMVRHEAPGELTIEAIVAQTLKIKQCMELVMKPNEHYGVIPGTGNRKDENGKPIPPKPTLLKPGAEKLCLLFRLDPEYDVVDKVESPALIRFTIRCTLTHIPTGLRTASGLGSCNSNEDKYLRPADKRCPSCEKTAIKKSKYPPRNQPNAEPGWYCFAKVGGCGKEFGPDDKAITEQDSGIKDPADLHNTILKMACKRALIAAVLNATAASDFFTQDLEDLTEKAAEYIPPKEPDLTKPLQTSVEQAIAKRDAAKATARHAPAAATGSDGTSDSSPAPSANPPTASSAESATPSSSDQDSPVAAADTGEAATDDQKDALRLHIRKKAWKLGYTRLWFAGLFGPEFAKGDPLEALTLKQADAAFTLLLAHGTQGYRTLRLQFADEGIVLRDENDISF